MRTIEIKLYNFNELSKEAKQVAIEQYRQKSYEYNDYSYWAIDDCGLFEPPHKEMIELFGEGYNFLLIENTRKNIYFSTYREWFLDCVNAMVIADDEKFYKWLGLPEGLYNNEDFYYEIYTPKYRNSSTTIRFDGYGEEYEGDICNAIDKFNSHIDNVLRGIGESIDYYFSDEYISEDIIINEYEFTEEGNTYYFRV
jgi:hypothetical protein